MALAQRTVRLFINGSDTGLSAVTDNIGFYRISAEAPENRGSFAYDVRFTEEPLYSSAQSSVVSVSLKPPGLPIVLIAAIVIVAVAIGAVVIKKRS
ncbi:MAG: hypothetical protein QMD16_17740 [Desulfitobacteriaceae bacterium]|nr:hypothetical protein [Desulfitobacteriaceae bacterium]